MIVVGTKEAWIAQYRSQVPGSSMKGLIADSFDCCYEGVSRVSGPDNLMMCSMAPCWSNQTSIKQLIHLNNHKIIAS